MITNAMKQVGGLALMVLALAACNPDTDMTQLDGSALEETALMESLEQALVEDMDAVSFGTAAGGKAWQEASAARGGLADCATVTRSGDTFPKTITIDFGEGCEGRRGHVKSGQIVVLLSDNLSQAGATRTVSFENFFVDDKAVTGSHLVSNEGQNEDGNWVLTRAVDLTVTDEEGATLTITTDGSKTWLAGFGEADPDLREYLITGTGSVTTPAGNTFSKTLVEAIHHISTCDYPLSGIVEVSGPERSGTLDFGNGECDSMATVIRNGESREIDLDEVNRRKRRRIRG